VSTFPLDEPHLAALREACTDTPEVRDGAMTVVRVLVERAVPMIPWFKAHHTISRPDLAAALVRDLLARAGIRVELRHHRAIQWRFVYYVAGYECWSAINDGLGRVHECLPRLISALCDLAPGDRDGALRALREVWR
jgi:hypothetical protein